MNTEEKIAIIGAGPVGLSAARALKTRGIAYDQFEADSEVGGNWRHGVYHSAHIISSKKTTEFSDYPMPPDYPDFPSAAQMLQYLQDYARHFGLLEHIRFDAGVELVSPGKDGLWLVRLRSGESYIYEGVIVCNGHHWDCRLPSYPGSFEGELIHSKDYKSFAQLTGKRVLVIGGGNSACDIVSEAARHASEAHLSLRRGYWFLPKTFYGVPTAEMLNTWMPVWLQRIYLKLLLKVVVGDYRDYGLMMPDHDLFEHHPTINTEVLHYLKHGKIVPHPDIKRFDGKSVEFVDGSTTSQIDLVVCGTGFNVAFPFLEPGVIEVVGSIAQVRWGVVAPHHRQLYVYGWGQARYGFGPLLTPASNLVADLIVLQRRLANPIGEILGKMRQPMPATHLLDPMAVLRQIHAAKRILWLLPIVDQYLMKKTASKHPPELNQQL